MNNEPVAYENTDKEIWRASPNDYYSSSIFVTKENNIGINVGGRVSVKTVEQWHNNTHPAKTLTAEDWLREKYGAHRAHFFWRDLEEAFNAGQKTNPAKTLTDEEILNTYYKVMSNIDPSNWKIEFARAILRKVQEK